MRDLAPTQSCIGLRFPSQIQSDEAHETPLSRDKIPSEVHRMLCTRPLTIASKTAGQDHEQITEQIIPDTSEPSDGSRKSGVWVVL